MRDEVEHLLGSFQLTLTDSELSPGEKQALRQLLTETDLSEEEKAFLRNRLFDLARDRTRRSAESRLALSMIDWLDAATKTLYRPGHKLIQEALFSPTDDCVNSVIGYLNAARSTLQLCVFTITDDRISRQILQCHRQGIEVSIITDNEKAFDPGADIKAMAHDGIAVRMDNTPNHMHHKFALIDDEILLTGSYNWTRSAAHYNHENILVTNAAAVVKRYRDCFQSLWPAMEPFPLN